VRRLPHDITRPGKTVCVRHGSQARRVWIPLLAMLAAVMIVIAVMGLIRDLS
jgi:hypothetical protein